MESIVDDDNACDFWPKEKKTQSQRYIYARRDTEDGLLEIILINKGGEPKDGN